MKKNLHCLDINFLQTPARQAKKPAPVLSYRNGLRGTAAYSLLRLWNGHRNSEEQIRPVFLRGMGG